MTNLLTSATRNQIIAVLAGETALPEFQDWLVGATWDVEERGDPDATDLTYDVKLAMAELSRGDISLTDFRERLGGLVGTTVHSH